MAAEKRHFTCVTCPVGCEVDVELRDGELVSMEGNRCAKAEEFVLQELREPMRILTTTVRIGEARWAMLPVRTEQPIPKRLFFDALRELANIEMTAPVGVSDIIVTNVAGTGSNVVAARNMKRQGDSPVRDRHTAAAGSDQAENPAAR